MTNYVHGRIPEAEILLKISRLCNRPMEWFLTEQDVVQYEKGNSELSARIRDAMAWNGMTIKELAEALGATEDEVDRISDGFLADPGIVADLCRILDVTSDWLFNGKGDGPPYWGEFINTQYSFFSALAKFVSHITLIDRQDLQQVLAGNAPAEILVLQNGLKDEILASLQVLLRSPAWIRRLHRSRAGNDAGIKYGSGKLPDQHHEPQQNNSIDPDKYLFFVAERDETGLSDVDRSHRATHSPGETTADSTNPPAPPNSHKPHKSRP
jgi:transcriptional regulator with XRE-family HTH domain